MIDNNFSILLVLKDRPSYTFRYMKYMDLLNFPYKILIAEGGENVEIQQVLENKDNFPNLNYDYIRYPYDNTLDDFHEKMSAVVKKISSSTVSVMDNDDFILMDGITKSLRVLEENPQYSSARGSIFGIDISNDVSGRLSVGQSMYTKFPDSIIADTAANRVIEQTNHFHGNWHNITRSNHIKASWEMINIAKPKNMRFTEQMTGYLNTLWGDGYRSDYPWLLHQQGQRIETNQGTLDSHYPEQEIWIKSDFWAEDFNKMTEVIGVAIAEYDNIPIEEAMNVFTKAYPLKLPSLKNLLQDRIKKASELGYNSNRINNLFEIVKKNKVKTIEQVSDIRPSNFSVEEELFVLSRFLLEME